MQRRQWLKAIASVGIGSSVFQRALAGQAAQGSDITAEMIRQAQWVAGIELSEAEQAELAQALQRKQASWQALRAVPLDPSREPVTPLRLPRRARLEQREALERPDAVTMSAEAAFNFPEPAVLPESLDDETLAFSSVAQLATLLRARRITSTQLTRLYLARLKKYDPLLKCVVTLTEELALEQAAAADREMSQGRFRGPLHGIPWGAKDLISVPGYPTTWGVPMFAQRELEQSATVYDKLTAAGAVLVAKLSLGALAMGDRWQGGMTRNPWNPELGSSGSSAGSASAVAAGLVGFAIGSETLGSILSPSRVCGNTGLRPTFGLVSRAGCMPLSWTMDKLGPMTRTAADAGLVLQAIAGWDEGDNGTVPAPYHFPVALDPSRLRIGYVRGRRRSETEGEAERPAERRDLKPFADLGCQLIEVELPETLPARSMTAVLEVEGASVFEAWLNAGQTEGWNAWPGIFRSAQFVTAVDYLRAQRLRGQLMEQMEALFHQVDVLVNANDLVITNLTGHPSLSLTDRFAERSDRFLPQPCVLTGRWYDDGLLATLGALVQSPDVVARRPPLDQDLAAWLEKEERARRDAAEAKDDDSDEKEKTQENKSADGG